MKKIFFIKALMILFCANSFAQKPTVTYDLEWDDVDFKTIYVPENTNLKIRWEQRSSTFSWDADGRSDRYKLIRTFNPEHIETIKYKTPPEKNHDWVEYIFDDINCYENGNIGTLQIFAQNKPLFGTYVDEGVPSVIFNVQIFPGNPQPIPITKLMCDANFNEEICFPDPVKFKILDANGDFVKEVEVEEWRDIIWEKDNLKNVDEEIVGAGRCYTPKEDDFVGGSFGGPRTAVYKVYFRTEGCDQAMAIGAVTIVAPPKVEPEIEPNHEYTIFDDRFLEESQRCITPLNQVPLPSFLIQNDDATVKTYYEHVSGEAYNTSYISNYSDDLNRKICFSDVYPENFRDYVQINRFDLTLTDEGINFSGSCRDTIPFRVNATPLDRNPRMPTDCKEIKGVDNEVVFIEGDPAYVPTPDDEVRYQWTPRQGISNPRRPNVTLDFSSLPSDQNMRYILTKGVLVRRPGIEYYEYAPIYCADVFKRTSSGGGGGNTARINPNMENNYGSEVSKNEVFNVEVYSLNGVLLRSYSANSNLELKSLDLPIGVYIIRELDEQSHVIKTFKKVIH
jgi:hypothetical protein